MVSVAVYPGRAAAVDPGTASSRPASHWKVPPLWLTGELHSVWATSCRPGPGVVRFRMLNGSVTLLVLFRTPSGFGGNAGGVWETAGAGRMTPPALIAAVSPGTAASVICARGTQPRLSP